MSFVVVGAGLAGGAAVRELREGGYDGPLVLIGDEAHAPYERPPLSKEYLRGEQGPADLALFPEDWYEDAGVERRLGVRVTGLDTRAREIELDGGDRLAYERLLIATGGSPRRLAEPADRIVELRRLEDATRLREHVRPGAKLVIVGAGFIGAEVAASARSVGADVTMIDPSEVPLRRALGEEMGSIYARIHRDHGVDLRLGEGVEKVESTADLARVTTTTGATIEGDAVVVGIGIVPNTGLAEEAGLDVDNGILVDAACGTSADGVYAAGDVANHDHPLFGRIRVEHFDNALKMGAAAARGMLGGEEPFDDPHWFWSDQYDVNLQYAGFAATWDDVVIRGSVDALDFVAFYLLEGRLLAALGMNRGREVRRSMKLIAARATPDPAALRDEDTDLRDLIPPP
ncbi:MAG TPA: FAD-dependent oxidoreductase [Actinomycetota bacterium]